MTDRAGEAERSASPPPFCARAISGWIDRPHIARKKAPCALLLSFSTPTRADNGSRETIVPIPTAKSFVSLFVLSLVSAWPLAGHAEDSSSGYRPNNAMQTPPLRVQVLDATTFADIETGDVYKLYGIDACASDQLAQLGRQKWPCGVMATAWLVTATLNKWLACRTIEENGGVRYARCASSEHPDLALDMLNAGMAVNAPAKPGEPVIQSYAAAEQSARKAFRGLWYSAFDMPWDYRAHHAAAPDDDKGPLTNPETNLPEPQTGKARDKAPVVGKP